MVTSASVERSVVIPSPQPLHPNVHRLDSNEEPTHQQQDGLADDETGMEKKEKRT